MKTIQDTRTTVMKATESFQSKETISPIEFSFQGKHITLNMKSKNEKYKVDTFG